MLGVIDYSFPAMSSYVIFDGGERWEGPFQVPYLQEDLVAGGDPVIAFDRDGNVYMNYISIGVDEFDLGPVEVEAEVSSIAVARSEDDGFTWPVQISAARSRVNTDGLEADRFGRLRGTVDISFLDKPWMTSGPIPTTPSATSSTSPTPTSTSPTRSSTSARSPTCCPRRCAPPSSWWLRRTAARPGATRWPSAPRCGAPTASRATAARPPASSAPSASCRAASPRSRRTAPCTWPGWTAPTTTPRRAWARSGWPARATPVAPGQPRSWPLPSTRSEFRPRSAFFRFWASAFPQIAVGPDGEIYIAYTGRPSDKPNDDGDIFLVSSPDGGATWSRPTVLNDDDTEHVQFFPSIDVGPDGAVHVMWGDMRDDPHQTRYHIYYTRSEDGGETFGFVNEELDLRSGDTRVTDFASNPNYAFPRGLFIGDYFSLAATDDDVHMVWSDSRLGEFGPINQKIGLRAQEAVPAPELFLSPPAGPGGQQVTLQGFDFQPDMGVFVQLGDSTISTLRTDLDGEFTARIYMPITSQGSQTITVFDESGNGASTSFFTEFGFGDIQKLLEDLQQATGGGAASDGASSDGPEASPTPSGDEG